MKTILAAVIVCAALSMVGQSAEAGRIYHDHYTHRHHHYHGHYPNGYTYHAPRQYVIPPRYYGPTPYSRGYYGRGLYYAPSDYDYGYYGGYGSGFSVQTPGFGFYIR